MMFSVAFCLSCSTENSPEDTPVPISSSGGSRGGAIAAPSTSSPQKKTAASPSAIVSRPAVPCTYTLNTSVAQPAGEEKEGAVVRIAQESDLQEPLLVYRVLGNLSVEGSFLAVDDMVFGSNGTHVTGTYIFELRTADDRYCYITIGISDADAAAKRNLIISPVFP